MWLYARFTLSYRDIEDLLAERGLDISYETVRRWFHKFGAPIAGNLRRTRPTPSDYWHFDEMAIMIRGKRHWLWRAVDNEGEILDFLVQPKRNARAALKLMRKLLKKQGWAPTRIVTDKLRSYHVAFRGLGLSAEHIDKKRANNRFDDESEKCRSLNHQAQHRSFSIFSPPLTTPSIYNATSLTELHSRNTVPKRSMCGRAQVLPLEVRGVGSPEPKVS